MSSISPNKKFALTSASDKPITLIRTNVSNENNNVRRKMLRNFRNSRNTTCPDCKEKGIIICDTSEGTQICNGCGMVVESKILSEEQEWRNFQNDGQSKNTDRNRVGEVSDIWLENNLTSTTFIKSTKEITKELQDMEQLKNRINNLNMLAVVYLACREAGHIKSIKELITFDRSYKEKDLGKTINKLKKVLPSRAFLSIDLIEAIEYVVKKASTLITTSHRLNSLCGGSIHLIVELNTNEEKNMKLPNLSQIATVCGVTTNTLKTTFKELLNAAEYIIPKYYLSEDNPKLSMLKQKYLSEDKRKKN
ncbi:transcription initiation factor TFIIB [Plasmodium falciparum IGH-CR14]|uniref:General transcription factor TFIIB n=1 Tax=Plasmodium falciparum IGH-CR14 TaxID=580059 RepID=A0A0L1IF14_PLAFA|nr:transcription initiation factor TFIIB [Plasmodium falciparum IGH-CR14]